MDPGAYIGISLACGDYVALQFINWLIGLLPVPKQTPPLTTLMSSAVNMHIYGVVDGD